MPFKSKAQQRWMFVHMPATARRWAHETRNLKRLPARASRRRAGGRRRQSRR